MSFRKNFSTQNQQSNKAYTITGIKGAGSLSKHFPIAIPSNPPPSSKVPGPPVGHRADAAAVVRGPKATPNCGWDSKFGHIELRNTHFTRRNHVDYSFLARLSWLKKWYCTIIYS